ncbi:SDR family NAD(P)-dependent oxidoreductase [Mycolicibacterium stellerae]|uniref:SDR family NAD(P)-dependent oxidoreductase n=1 Tax=Mycolicibacterium stellerae TaxID=2358193 RepID=UPI000F0B68F0|nr:SDR family oxidoreductase [Mycolicibacterium stellerae]
MAVSLVGTGVAAKVALVTGAGRGVGQQIALTLAEHGARVVIVNDSDADRANQVADQVRMLGADTLAIQADVGDPEAVAEMFAHTAQRFGPLGVLVNNAGIRTSPTNTGGIRPFLQQETTEWESLLRVNFLGVVNCTRGALEQMAPAGYGRIVTIVSDAGRVGATHGMEVYSGAKAGAAGFTRAVARLGGRFGITANCVSLGATRTPATAEELADEEVGVKVLAQYIVRRFGEPTDAAAAVLFLCSESAGWITGQTLAVNGGFSLAL